MKKIETIPGLVSVVLVNLNGINLLEKFLPSLATQTYRDVEIFMVDNGSTDRSVQWVESNYPDIKIIKLPYNHGFSIPNNIAIREAKGEFVLTLNTDMLLESDFIEELVGAIKEDASAGWAAPKLLKLTRDFEKRPEVDCFGHHMSRTRFAREADYSVVFDPKDYEEERYVFGASACGALYRREMLEDIAINGEYFDEDFFAYFEDVDLDWRAQLRGWKCLYTPRSVGYHMRGGTGLKKKRPAIAACEFSNRFFLVIKNDSRKIFINDFFIILRRTLKETLKYLLRNPAALFFGVKRIFKYLPTMIRKRKIIQLNKKVGDSYMRDLIKGQA